jgi:hypothetical protein
MDARLKHGWWNGRSNTRILGNGHGKSSPTNPKSTNTNGQPIKTKYDHFVRDDEYDGYVTRS